MWLGMIDIRLRLKALMNTGIDSVDGQAGQAVRHGSKIPFVGIFTATV